MNRLLPLITGVVSGELATMIANAKREAVLLAVIAFFALIAISFGLVAAELALAGVFGPIWSSLIIGGAALFICLIVFIVLKIQTARARRQARERREAAASYATAATAFLPFVLRSKAAIAVGIPLAALAGYLLVPGKSQKRDDD